MISNVKNTQKPASTPGAGRLVCGYSPILHQAEDEYLGGDDAQEHRQWVDGRVGHGGLVVAG